MLDDQQIFNTLKQMPEPLKAELVHYMEFLLSKYSQQQAEHQTKIKRQAHPKLAGALIIQGDLFSAVEESEWDANQ